MFVPNEGGVSICINQYVHVIEICTCLVNQVGVLRDYNILAAIDPAAICQCSSGNLIVLLFVTYCILVHQRNAIQSVSLSIVPDLIHLHHAKIA